MNHNSLFLSRDFVTPAGWEISSRHFQQWHKLSRYFICTARLKSSPAASGGRRGEAYARSPSLFAVMSPANPFSDQSSLGKETLGHSHALLHICSLPPSPAAWVFPISGPFSALVHLVSNTNQSLQGTG